MNAILRFLVERALVVNLVSIFLVVIGIYAMLNINREAFPNVNFDTVQIDTVYPGSTPAEIERLVITPIEQELKSLNGIDKMTSIAFPGSGRVILELEQDASNRDRIVSDVQLAVDRASLPTDLPQEPIVLEIDGQMIPVLNFAISSPRSEVELKRLGIVLKMTSWRSRGRAHPGAGGPARRNPHRGGSGQTSRAAYSGR